jgi:hypothetical protein
MIVKHLNKDIEQILQSDIIEDDTIEMIKYKVSQELGCEMHEIYLFAQQERQFNLHTIYEELLKKTDTITSDDVDNICADVSIEKSKKTKTKKTKESYTYDELLNLLNIDTNTIYFPIGHTLRECANPFKCTKPLPFDRVEYKTKKNIPLSLSKTILLDYFPFIDNTLYVVRQSDLDKELHDSYFGDVDLDTIATIKSNIDQKTKFLANQQNNITDSSVRFIQFTILPTQTVQLSLESIFNLFHATELYPMIHYYTGKTVIYKLFTQEKDVHNHKIPVLAESVIYHVGDKDIKTKSVNIYVDNRNSCVLFYEDGSIGVHIKKSKSISETDLNAEIQKLLLPILQIVKEPVYQSGYEYSWEETSNIFTSSSSNIRIDELEYELQLTTNILDQKEKFKYISNVCIDITVPKEESQLIYIYKSGYDSNQLYDQVVKYLMAKLDTSKKITDRLKTMFNLSDANAKKLFADYAPSETSAVHSTAINIGFKISFISSPPTVVIQGINNIHYLPSMKTNFNCISNIVNGNLELPTEIEMDKKEVKEPVVEVVEDFQEEPDAFGGDGSAYDNDPGSDEEEENTGGGIEDLDKIDKDQYNLKNPNFAVNRLLSKYNLDLPGVDYNRKCLRQHVPIIISKKEWESDKYKLYKDRLDTMENGDKYVSIQDDHVLVCPKYWSFKKQKAYLDDADFEQPRSKDDIFEFNAVNSKITRYELNKHGEYYEYPNYHHSSNIPNQAKYPYFTKNNFPCCGLLLHKKKQAETEIETKVKENSTNQYIVGKVEPIDTKEKVFKYGYLPEPLCDFFDLVEKKIFRESVDSDPYELLRWGVPNKNYQFLHTMHTIYKLTNKDIDFKTYVGKMEDGFKYAQNGNIYNKYLSFQEFMKDSKHIIHEEAWDLVSNVHDKNIIIFKDNDDAVELICPSNVYGKKIDVKKQCIMLYYFEKDNCYEPMIKKPKNKHDVQFEFDVQDPYLKQAFETITKTYERCKPIIDYEIEEDAYTPVSNISSTEMYDTLYDKFFEDIQQVSQYNKCVGFIVEQFFIPCYPSKLIPDVHEIVEPPSKGVVETIEFLNRMHSSFDFPCRPHYKVIKQSQITGILTETFHYVPCIPEKNTKKIALEIYYGNLTHEYIQFKENSEDLQRVKTTHRILYEKYGFTYCKNQLMIALNQHEYVENRNKIKKIIHVKKAYNEKLEEITQEIHKVMQKHLGMKIEWVNEMPDSYIQDMLDQCPNGFCDGKLYLPKTNLVTKEPNDYYKRLADDLIRNKQVELFVLKPEIQFYVPYQAQENELILDGNVIENYLEQLGKPAKVHKYYDNVNLLKVERKKLIFSVIKLDKIKITE